MPSQPEIVTLEPVPTAAVRGTVSMDELRDFYDRAFDAVASAVARQRAVPTVAYGLYLSPPGERFDLEVGFLIDGEFSADGEVVPSSLPGGRAARLEHLGSYEQLGAAWQQLMEWVGQQGLAPAGPMWEVYVTEPTPDTDPATLQTDLFCIVG